jgi:hypothetical protein
MSSRPNDISYVATELAALDAPELAAIFDEDFKANARSLLLDNYARDLRTTSLDISSLSSEVSAPMMWRAH